MSNRRFLNDKTIGSGVLQIFSCHFSIILRLLTVYVGSFFIKRIGVCCADLCIEQFSAFYYYLNVFHCTSF